MSLLSTISLIFTACCLAARGASFAIDGDVDANCPTINYEIKVPFHMVLSSNKWQIKVQFKNYNEFCWSDGDKVSSFVMFPKETYGKSLPKAQVLNGDYPYHSDPSIQFIWLAFCSSQYFLSNTNTMPALWQMGSLDPLREAIDITNLVFMDSQMRLPSNLDLILASGYMNSITNMHYLSKTVSTLELEKTFNDYKQYSGFLAGRYSVTTVTNLESRLVPVDFNLIVYDPTKDQVHSIRQTYRGIVTSIKLSNEEPSIPSLPYPIWIEDGRFSDARTRLDSISYIVTNQDWPATNDETLQEQFLEKKKKQAAVLNLPNLSETNVRLLPRILIGFTIISFPLLVFLRWIKKRK